MPDYYQPGMAWTAARANRWATHRIYQLEDLVLTNQTTPVTTDIQIPVETGAEYEYQLLISYSAEAGADTSMAASWSVPGSVMIHRFTLSHAAAALGTPINAGGVVILRRPAAGTNHIIGGSTATNFHSARDTGVIEAGGTGLMIWRVQQTGAGSATPTILRGGAAQTQILYRRIN